MEALFRKELEEEIEKLKEQIKEQDLKIKKLIYLIDTNFEKLANHLNFDWK